MREALAGLPGVTEVQPNVSSKSVVCKVNPEKFDESQAIEALAKAGYKEASVKK